MYSSRLVHLAVVVVSIIAFSQAAFFDLGPFKRSVVALEARQLLPTSTSRTTSQSATTSSTTSSSPTSSSEPPTSSLTTSTRTTLTTSSSLPPPVTSSSVPPTTTTPPSTPPTSSPTTTDDTSRSVVTQTTVVVVETTGSDGQKTSVTSSATYTTSVPLSQGSGSNSSGITDGTRNIIIGVCVGVGGAIILGVVAFVFWRLRNRRSQQDDHDDLAGTSEFNHGHDKSDHSGSVSGRSPFQSTLESYHAPSQANTASNF